MNGLILAFKTWRRKNRVKRISNPADGLETMLRWVFLAVIGLCGLALFWFSVSRP